MSIRRQEALDYHSQGRPGKIQVSPTKPFKNQRDLSLAYTPGVAEPCREIAERPEEAYTYTAKGNLVAVVTNGTAVLGLGNIGPLARLLSGDQKGLIHSGRNDLDRYKSRFAQRTKARTLAEALQDADVFVGLSVAGIVSGQMLQAMAPRPIVFALANPTPEIMPDEARQARKDAVIATGRSDFPNQVNNVLGFPFIFRGALDVRAKKINGDMEMAATRALAALAKEEVPDAVRRAYGLERLRFGPEYLIPKPFDPRVLLWVAPAVAWAAVGSGVAGRVIDVDEYRAQLDARLGRAREVMRGLSTRVQQHETQRI